LNTSEETEVSIESGRASANLKTMTISHHFFSYPDRKLYKSIWFVVKNPKGPTLEPVLPFEDACKIEGLYKGTIKSSNALATVKDKSSEEVKLTSEGEFKVVVSRSNGRISLRKKQASGFGAILDKGKLLQRGFGNYDVKGEDIELALGPVKHLIFVVHGVGKIMFVYLKLSRLKASFSSLFLNLLNKRRGIMELFRKYSFFEGRND